MIWFLMDCLDSVFRIQYFKLFNEKNPHKPAIASIANYM